MRYIGLKAIRILVPKTGGEGAVVSKAYDEGEGIKAIRNFRTIPKTGGEGAVVGEADDEGDGKGEQDQNGRSHQHQPG